MSSCRVNTGNEPPELDDELDELDELDDEELEDDELDELDELDDEELEDDELDELELDELEELELDEDELELDEEELELELLDDEPPGPPHALRTSATLKLAARAAALFIFTPYR